MAAAAVQSLQWHSSICRAAALVCPTLISARSDWQPRAGPSNNPVCTFSISFPSWHIQPSRKKKSSDPSLSSIPSLSGLIMSVGKKKQVDFSFPRKVKVREHQSAFGDFGCVLWRVWKPRGNWVFKTDGQRHKHTETHTHMCILRVAQRIWVRAWSRFSMAVCNSSSKLISLSLISSQRSVRSAASASLNPSWEEKETTRDEREWLINKWSFKYTGPGIKKKGGN